MILLRRAVSLKVWSRCDLNEEKLQHAEGICDEGLLMENVSLFTNNALHKYTVIVILL